MPTMQAWRLHSYGGPDTMKLDTVEVPVPGPTQALVSVSYAGMNPFDWKIREGYVKDFMPLPLPYTLGVDFVGTVTSLGSNAGTRLKPGDRVLAFNQPLGAFAESIVLEADFLAKVPDSLSDEVAATLPIPAQTALQALHAAGNVGAGTRILIQGASGIVGAFAIQFAKGVGAHVIGTASGKNKSYVLGLGADEFIDYSTQDFVEEIKEPVDVVLDFVLIGGAADTNNRSFKVLKKGGQLITVADPSLAAPGAAPEGYKASFPQIKPDYKELEEIAKQVVEGKITSKVAKVFKRGELVEAMELNKKGGTTGRLIVNFKEA